MQSVRTSRADSSCQHPMTCNACPRLTKSSSTPRAALPKPCAHGKPPKSKAAEAAACNMGTLAVQEPPSTAYKLLKTYMADRIAADSCQPRPASNKQKKRSASRPSSQGDPAAKLQWHNGPHNQPTSSAH